LKIAFFSTNQSFCGDVIADLSAHHELRNWKYTGDKNQDIPNMVGLINWCDLVYCDFIQYPAPWITKQQWLDKPVVMRMDGIDILNHVAVDWRKVSALVLMPVQKKRLQRLRTLQTAKGNRLPNLPSKILEMNIGVDLTLFQPLNKTPGYEIVYHSNVMREVKKPYIILQSFKELIDRDPENPWRLTMLGQWEGGWDWKNRVEYVMCLRELLEDLDIPEDRITLRDNLSRQLWAQTLPGFDIIWSYSHREGFPNSVGEGASAGVYPIMNSFYGAELIYPEKYRVRSPMQLVEKTVAWGALSDEEKQVESKAARKHISQYDRFETARRIRLLCEEVIDDSIRGPR